MSQAWTVRMQARPGLRLSLTRRGWALFLSALFLAATAPVVEALQSGDFIYTTDGIAITITGYTGSGGELSIPDTIDGLTVTGIGEQAFESCSGLTRVTIPDSVTTIGDWAFYDCDWLTSVTLGNGVTRIGPSAFQDCFSLAGVTMGTGVTNIGSSAFQSCTALTSVRIPDSVISIGGYAFKNCSGLTGLAIGNGVTSIGDVAFGFCSGLARVTIPDSVTVIGKRVFEGCTGLISVTIPGSVTNVDLDVFKLCRRLARVFFKGNAPSVDANIFLDANQTTVYYLPRTTGWAAAMGGRPTVLWNAQVQAGGSFGMRAGQFGFSISGTSNLVIVVEACTSLAHSVWCPVGTNTLTGGTSAFSDPQAVNHSARFYRIQAP